MTDAAIVTGAASGIGQAVARRLTERFDRVIGVDVNVSDGDEFVIVSGDVTQERPLEAVAAVLGDATVSCVVHSAGILLDAEILETSAEEFLRVFRVNVLGTHNVVRSAMELMVNGGVIVLLSSQHAFGPSPRRGAYAASKAAVSRMTSDYGREAAARGVRVVAMAPGPTMTPMTASRFEDPQEVERVERRMATGRVSDVDEIADVITFLTSDGARAIVGQTVVADSGFLNY